MTKFLPLQCPHRLVPVTGCGDCMAEEIARLQSKCSNLEDQRSYLLDVLQETVDEYAAGNPRWLAPAIKALKEIKLED